MSAVGESDAFDLQVLAALLEGFRARAGAKERHQALTEYEVARRVGIVEHSYVEYESSSQRDAVRSALSRLQRQGMARAVAISGRYETFVPSESALDAAPAPAELPDTDAGDAPRRVVEAGRAIPAGASASQPADLASEPAHAGIAEPPLPTTFEGRLDEMIRLLRSIDRHLERITRS